MTRALQGLLTAAVVWLLLPAPVARAAQQFQGLCALVKMEIAQELTLERVGFLATLEVTNNEGDANITDFSASLTFESLPDANGDTQDASGLFFVRAPQISGTGSIDGAGIIRPGETARISWFIIPKIAAGGTTPDGVRYRVGASLAGSIYGQVIAPEVLTVIPDTITVRPEPQLSITYFQPRDVDGDDPFTPPVEAPIPFTLGVLVNNTGYGRAREVKVASEQPRIVENEQDLVLVAQLLGARIDDEPTDQTSLTLNVGDIEPGACRKGAWDMITSLSGTFIDFKASYTHASDLGGRDTSIIESIDAHFILHEVRNDQPGRDDLKDFLADTLSDDLLHPGSALVPDTLFESDCSTLPVNVIADAEVVTYDGASAVVEASPQTEDWVFVQVDDPAQAKYPIERVVRSDGKVLDPNNVWTSIRYRFEDNQKLTFLNIFDFVELADYTYTVVYGTPPADPNAPVTTLRFAGQVEQVAGKFVVAPETQLYFTVDDASPVSIFYRFQGDADFLPGVPFTITQPGERVIEYFSRDAVGNEEAPRFATVMLAPDFPTLANLSVGDETFFLPGDALSVRPTETRISFDAGSPVTTTGAVVAIYRGVYAFPTLEGVPASPTPTGEATITVGGPNVDFYRHRLNGGAWSAEAGVAQPISLAGMTGEVALEVLGRSQFGSYPEETSALSASWTVDTGAPGVGILGPATPSRATSASFTVEGASFYCYRLDQSFYRPEPAGGAPITFDRLAEGQHVVEVLERSGPADPCPGDVPGTALRWLVNRDYGTVLPAEALVATRSFADVGSATVDFAWDGTDAGGTVVPAGHYTVVTTVLDGLDRSTSEVSVVEVGDLLEDGPPVPAVAGADQRAARAAGRFAVWQDQRSGDWDIYARDLLDPMATPVRLTSSTRNEERPRTDGEYVVWEDRQADGTWDVWARKLGAVEAAFAVTATPGFDERRPSIDWPWVAYQQRPAGSPGAPWQLGYRNLLSGATGLVDPSTQDQLDPVVQGGRVVWQDLRDAGAGEIYFANLATGELRRITNSPASQIQPTLGGDWIVWADNRAGLQLDLYGLNLARGVEVRLTDTPQDESRPSISDRWAVYLDDAAGPDTANLRLLELGSTVSVQLTNFESAKSSPSVASGKVVWVDERSGDERVRLADLPDLQLVFRNANAVAVTGAMANLANDAFSLLRRWHDQAGVTEIRRYTALVPQPVAENATWSGGSAAGTNFPLEPGAFLWVTFGGSRVLDLGTTSCGALDLPAGVSAFSFTCFPDGYTSFAALRELGLANVRAIRALDAGSGRWSVATVQDGAPVGEDFPIPRVSVVMIDLAAPVSSYLPGEGD